MKDNLRFRQVHLDFHTSGKIKDIGRDFNATKYVERLTQARVNSINIFAKCHHGYSYYDTSVGEKHPGLTKDLFKAQYEACKNADINAAIYISVCWDEHQAWQNPGWRQILPDGTFHNFLGKNLEPSWSFMCLNSPYLDFLCEQISEVVQQYPEADGVWLDIINQQQCCCNYCRSGMEKNGLDWTLEEDRIKFGKQVISNYYAKTFEAVKKYSSKMPVFHNQGHIPRGDRERFNYYDHLEIESLPTGGWGYDHFPLSAKYAESLDREYLGMTGRFHIIWGEFGGYKHPNALKYECAAMLANGAKCSVGDHMHPLGELDKTTYDIIEKAYTEVEAKEPWCIDSVGIADVAILSSLSINAAGVTGERGRNAPEDDGASRMLLESHIQYAVIDQYAEFGKYKLLILPDRIKIDENLKLKLDKYTSEGGHLLLTGVSGVSADEPRFAIEIGAELVGGIPDFAVGAELIGGITEKTNYILPNGDLLPEFMSDPILSRSGSTKISVTTGDSLGDVFKPYFERSAKHFNGHQHAPIDKSKGASPCGVSTSSVTYLAHCIFSEYFELGMVAQKHYVINVIRSILGRSETLRLRNLPSTGRAMLRHQNGQNRDILHLLYGTPVLRGKTFLGPIEVIEDLPIIDGVQVTMNCRDNIDSIYTAPDGDSVNFKVQDNQVTFEVPAFSCHQMVVIQYQS